MSKYTTEVRYICEEAAGLKNSVGYKSIDEVLSDETLAKIFDFDFPIFDEAYRLVLERKILKHYYTREIAHETVGLWKLRLDVRLNEIMPYYNKLYESDRLKFNPLNDVDYKTTHKGNESTADAETIGRDRDEKSGNTSASTSHTQDTSKDSTKGNNTQSVASNATTITSDTPQGGLNGVFGVGGMEYASAASNNKTGSNTLGSNASNTESENDSNTSASQLNSGTLKSKENEAKNRLAHTTDEYVREVVGKMGTQSYSKYLIEFRETFLKIDQMVIDELSDLFFGLW